MRVSVRTQGHLKQFRADRLERFILDLPDGATVGDVITVSGIPWDEVAMAAVNGAQAREDRVLADGDRVMLLPPLEGG